MEDRGLGGQLSRRDTRPRLRLLSYPELRVTQGPPPQPSDPKTVPLSPAPTVPGPVGGHRVNLKGGSPLIQVS